METAEASSLVSSEAAAVDSLGHYVAATTETPPRPAQPFLEPESHFVNSEGARAFSKDSHAFPQGSPRSSQGFPTFS